MPGPGHALGGGLPPPAFGQAPVDPARQQQVIEQLESLALGPDAPGQPDMTDSAFFPRPIVPFEDGINVAPEDFVTPAPAEDGRNCDPRVMRCSVNAIPGSASLKAGWHIPLSLIVRPLADFGKPVPLVDGTQPNAIIRCNKCRAYVNPFVTWTNAGRQFRCIMCGHLNDTPPEAYVVCDQHGVMQDDVSRPDLSCGTVDYSAPADYAVRPPMPACYFFIIDVSQAAVQSGALAVICEAIRSCLDHLQRESLTRVGFLTYDTTLHFYNLNPALSSPQMMVVADLEDPFPPLPDDHFVNLEASRGAIDRLLSVLPTVFANNTAVETAMGPALQAAFRTVNHLGGKLMLFLTSPPTLGPGKMKQREQPSLYNTDREFTLRQPADPFFKEFVGECIQKQITVDVFSTCAHYADLCSLDLMPRYTAGHLYHYPNFTATRDATKLRSELVHNLTRKCGWEAVMRLRCSAGLRISTFHGHLYVRANDLLALPTVDEDDTFVAQIQMEDTLLQSMQVKRSDLQNSWFDGSADKQKASTASAGLGVQVFVQCALLYTASNCERRIRVHTIALNVVNSPHDIFEAADAAANASVLCKLAVEKALKSTLAETRKAVERKTVATLKEYKTLQAQVFRYPSRLAFPRSLRLLPLWVLGSLKCTAIHGGAETNPDERCAVASLIMVAPPELLCLIAYPALFQLHTGGWGQRSPDGKLVLPPRVPLRFDYLDPSGAYLMDAGRIMFLWVGRNASLNLVKDLLGPQAADTFSQGKILDVNLYSAEPGVDKSTLSERLQDLLAERRRGRCVWPQCFTIMQSTPQEHVMLQHMVEDRQGKNGPSYQEFLQALHKGVSMR